MSERGLGVAERGTLDRARTRLVTLRAEQYRLLEDIAELERLGVAQQTGDRATPRLLQDLSTLDLHEAKRLTEESADLAPRSSLLGEPLPPRLPVTATVYASGEIGPAHVVIIRRTMAHLERLETVSVEDWFAAERVLGDDATRLPPRLLQRVAARLILQFDPDGAVPPEGEDCRDELHLVRRRDGRLEFKGRLHDPVDGEVFLGAIDPLAEPFGPDDTRSLAQRRIDALKDIVGDSGRPGGLTNDTTHPDDADAAVEADGDTDAHPADEDDAGALIPQPRRPEPAPARAQRPGRALLTITMDLRWLQLATGHGALDTGAPVDPATVRRWACDADIVPVVLGSRSEPLDVGRMQRTVTDAMRRALNIRDGGCAFPGCDRPPRRCHAHHIRFWANGGDTCLHEPRAAVPTPPPGDPPRPLGRADRRRSALVHPTELDRPRPATPTRRPTPRPPLTAEFPIPRSPRSLTMPRRHGVDWNDDRDTDDGTARPRRRRGLLRRSAVRRPVDLPGRHADRLPGAAPGAAQRVGARRRPGPRATPSRSPTTPAAGSAPTTGPTTRAGCSTGRTPTATRRGTCTVSTSTTRTSRPST